MSTTSNGSKDTKSNSRGDHSKPGDATVSKPAAEAMPRLRIIIAELDWSAFSPGMTVTMSAGVATLRADENSDTFLARADCALYAAKARGRNRITSA